MELVALDLGIGILPLFVARSRKDLVALTDPLDEAQTELWLLTHPEARHLRRVTTVYRHLAEAVQLP
jgi:DNA-binding transcriptional LysR family regulator